MEGVWKINPFYWMALRRFSRKQKKQSLAFQQTPRLYSRRQEHWHNQINNLNPFRWSKRAIRVFVTGFFTIMLPIYAYLGMQPAVSLEVSEVNHANLQIDSISLSLPVESLTLQDKQLIAPASVVGSYSAASNKVFLIGHSSTAFQDLHQVALGDSIAYNNSDYEITDIVVLEKTDIDMNKVLAATNEPTLVLMTCAGQPLPNQDATHRLIVTAVEKASLTTINDENVPNYTLTTLSLEQ